MLLLSLLTLALAAEGPVVYAEVGGHALTLDVWRPEGEGPHPGVLILHGGGWKYGDLYENVEPQARAAAAAGLVAVSANYRLSTEAIWPAQVDDVGCALRWVRAHAGELALDPDRIGVVGHSAGGHLALMLAEEPERPAPAGCPSQAGAEVQAAASIAGPSDLRAFYEATRWWGRKMARELLGLSPSASRRRLARALSSASPAERVDAQGPPVLQVVGAEDPLVPPSVIHAYDQRLQAAGRESAVQEIPGGGHNDVNRVELWLPWMLDVLNDAPRGPG